MGLLLNGIAKSACKAECFDFSKMVALFDSKEFWDIVFFDIEDYWEVGGKNRLAN